MSFLIAVTAFALGYYVGYQRMAILAERKRRCHFDSFHNGVKCKEGVCFPDSEKCMTMYRKYPGPDGLRIMGNDEDVKFM